MSVADECAAWRAGTLDTWSDPNERRFHDSAPGGFTSQAHVKTEGLQPDLITYNSLVCALEKGKQPA